MAGEFDASQPHEEDRMKMLKAFDETKAGVKGLVDSGCQKIPKIFVRPSDELARELTPENNHPQTTLIRIPVIDLSNIQTPEGRKRAVEEVKTASETWGFFQVVNHGIPTSVLDRMIDGVRGFHEQDVEEKRKFYTRDFKRAVRFSSNFDLYSSRTANWRDTLSISFPDEIVRDELPRPCRDSTIEYSKHVTSLGNTLLGLLSSALGLKPDHLNKMECSKGVRMGCHYYPACPEPHLTLGATKHSDLGFLTILLQSQITGLQVLHQAQWADVEPSPGALVVNIGDLLQLVSNGKFRSIKHRVLANRIGPRISVACFSAGNLGQGYGPIKELLSEENPAQYRDVLMVDYVHKFQTTGLDEYLGIDYYNTTKKQANTDCRNSRDYSRYTNTDCNTDCFLQ